jgi:hypothetical protein
MINILWVSGFADEGDCEKETEGDVAGSASVEAEVEFAER